MSSLESLVATLPPNTLPHFLENLIHTAHSHGGHSHSHAPAPSSGGGADPIALWVSAGSIAVKEWLFRATKRVATQTNSTVLLANAWHHRTDALTSLVALFAIAGGQIYPFLDPVGGCLVSLLIIKVGYQSGKAACQEIVDRGLDAEVLGEVREGAVAGLGQVVKGLPAAKDVQVVEVRGTKSGAYYIVDVDVEGGSALTWDAFEVVRDGVEEGVKEGVPSVKICRVSLRTRKDDKANGKA
jgi:divalent metal cation (Fe/Co/Zn/Cd) transporter